MKPIILFGGTFDPIHNGHLELCRAAYRQLNPECILLIPSAQPPHKQSAASTEDRVAMCRLAAEHLPYVKVDTWEAEQAGKTYSVHTAMELEARYPGRPLYWLMGMDAWITLSSWYRWRDFCDHVTPLVAGRSNCPRGHSETYTSLMVQQGVCPVFLDWTPVEASSSRVRELLAQGKEADLLLPAVYTYIRDRGLYSGESR